MEKKEEKRSFWASLFTPKTCSCSCGNNIIEELEDDEKEQLPKVPAKNENENRSEEENHCSCCEKNNQT